MNIGIDIRCLMSSARAGVAEYTYELLNAIFKLDKNNQYFLFYNSHTDVAKNIPRWSQKNVHYVATRWPNKLFNACIKTFGVPKIDTLIKNSTTHYLLSTPLDVFFSPNFNFTALSKNVKHILTVHDLSFKFYPYFFSAKQRLWHWAINPKTQCQQAEIILTLSENTKRDIVDYYKILPEKIKVIYPGGWQQNPTPYPSPIRGGAKGGVSREQHIKQRYSLPDKFILFLGTIEPRKNIIGLIEAFEKSYSSLPTSYSLVIAGHKGWNDKKIYAKAVSSPLKDKINFIGYVEADDKPGLYSLSELFVYPSFYEGFGFPVLEAMAGGVPVITSNRSSLPEITNHAAYLINPNRPSEISQAIIKLLTDANLREHFKKKGLEQAKKFSWETTARQWLDMLNIL